MPKLAAVLPPIVVGRLKEPGDHPVGGVSGLMLRISPTGARSWVLRVRVAGRRPEFGLGAFPAVGLGDARAAAALMLADIRKGGDPAATKSAARAALVTARANSETFSQAAEKFIEANKSAWTPKHGAQWKATLATHAEPIIGNTPVADLSVALILKVVRPIWLTVPVTASDSEASRERLNPARIEAIHAVLPLHAKVASVKPMESLPYAELPAFWVRLIAAPGLGAKALAWSIVTAARSGMTRAMRWQELDLVGMLWTVPPDQMKTGKPWSTPITAEMVSLLPPAGKPSEFVFAGTRRGKPLSDMTLTRTLERMGVAVVPHGFRATFKTWAAETTDHHAMAAELQLAHIGGGALEMKYQRGELREKRAALVRDWVSYVTSATTTAEVEVEGSKPAPGLRLVG